MNNTSKVMVALLFLAFAFFVDVCLVSSILRCVKVDITTGRAIRLCIDKDLLIWLYSTIHDLFHIEEGGDIE